MALLIQRNRKDAVSSLRNLDMKTIFNIQAPKFNKPQEQFLFSTARHTMYNGGVGAGKTFAGIWRTILFAMYIPKSRHLVGTYTYPMLRDSVISLFLKQMNAYFPKYLWDWQIGDKTLRIGDSEILFRQFNSEETLRGPGYNSIWADEFTVGIDQDIFQQLASRLREGKNQWFSGTTNPGSKSHHLYDFYFNPPPDEAANRLVINAPTLSNAHNLPAEYIKDLMSRPERWRKRFLAGEWGAMTGLVYLNFDRAIHVSDFEPDPNWIYYMGIDFGFTNPFACVLIGIDTMGRYYVCREYYQRRVEIEDHAAWINTHFIPFHPVAYAPDFEDPEKIQKLQKLLQIKNVMWPNKNVQEGIHTVESKLVCRANPEGLIFPNLMVHASCKNTIREFESWEFAKAGKNQDEPEEPMKKDNHALDAIRYVIHTLESRKVKRNG